MRTLIPASALLTLLLAACGGSDKPAAPQAAAPPPPPQKTVFDDQLKAIDKAKAVEGKLEEEKAKTDERVKDAGG